MRSSILVTNPDIKHGTLKILFTPDEEVGHGVDHVDIKKLGADFAYTMDGESAGELEDETFSADKATVTIRGVSAHPGFAKGKIENAIKIAVAHHRAPAEGHLLARDHRGPRGLPPPDRPAGDAREARHSSFIVRDFSEEGLREKEALLNAIAKDVMRDFPHSTCEIRIEEQYRNMKVVLDRHPADHRKRARSDPPCRAHAEARPASAAAPTARGFRSWACPAPISLPASTRFTRGSNG